MKFIVGVPIGGPTYNPADIGTIARRADELGFDAINASERLIMPRHIESKYPYGPKGDIPGVGTLQNTLEVLSVMAFVAGQTSRARLLPSVIVLPYRNPMLAAKILATIDQLSQGRLVVGCGVGWNVEEAQALMVPTPFEKRGAVSNEYIRAWKELWSKEEPEFHGEFLDFAEVDFAPKTVQQPSPPFWVGGESPAAIRRAATLCDGWLPSDSNPVYPLDTTERFTNAVSESQETPGSGGTRPARLRDPLRRRLMGRRRQQEGSGRGDDPRLREAGRHPPELQRRRKLRVRAAGADGELRRRGLPARPRLAATLAGRRSLAEVGRPCSGNTGARRESSRAF